MLERLMAADREWAVDIADSVERFEADWRALAGPANSTPFQDYDVMRVFHARLAAEGDDQSVIARVRHPDGRPAAIFPMTRGRQHGLNWLRTDARPIDYCAPIFDPALSPVQIKAIIKAMLAAVPRADMLYVNRIPQQFESGPSPLVEMPNSGRLRLSSWQLTLSGRSNDDLTAGQQKRLRQDLKSRTRSLGEKHQRVFAIAFGADVDPAVFAAFKLLRAKSFSERGRSNILDDSLWGPAYQDLLGVDGGERGWLATLHADGEMVAAVYGIVVGGRVQVILPASSTTDQWKSFRPGLQLFRETMFYFQNSGFSIYDLSIGDMAYKAQFGCDELGLYDAMFPKTLAGHSYYAFWRIKVKIRSKMKTIAAAS